jgi:ADP-heptose:LPS heptosyltransferase
MFTLPSKYKVLVFVQGTIGDTIVSIPALRALRRHYGDGAEITLLHETHSHLSFNPQSVLSELKLVEKFISYPFSFNYWEHRAGVARLMFRLLRERFHSIYYLIASGREPRQITRDNTFFRLCGIRRRHGFRIFNEFDLRPKANSGELLRVENEALIRLQLVSEAGVDTRVEKEFAPPIFQLPEVAINEARHWLASNGLPVSGRSLVAIAPGAKKATCLWPLHRFAEIGQLLRESGLVDLVVVGGKAERDASIALMERWNGGHSACGGLSILGSAALLSHCDLLVGLDTGTTHLAAALGTPCVALYAAQDWPGRWEPLGRGHTVFRKAVPCAGCRLKNCNMSGHPCMTQITVDEVYASASRALGWSGIAGSGSPQ